MISVRLGEWNLLETNDCKDNVCNDQPVDIPVEAIIKHKHYDRETEGNDIALLRLSKVVKFTENIKPICLPLESDMRNEKLVGKAMVVAGWGKSQNNSYPTTITKFNVEGISRKRCNKIYEDITKSQICAVGVDYNSW